MLIQRKMSKGLQQSPLKTSSDPHPLQEQCMGYNFLRNIWTTYFNGRQNASIQDKIDKINKVVCMVKTQIKTLTIHQTKQRQNNQKQHGMQHSGQIEDNGILQLQLQRIKQAYQRRQMRNQQLEYVLYRNQEKMKKLQHDNFELKGKLAEIKKAKNNCEENIIQLSKKVYELQRNYTSFIVNQDDKNDLNNISLCLYSAHTEELNSDSCSKLIDKNKDFQTRRQLQDLLRFDNSAKKSLKKIKSISQFPEPAEVNLNLPNNQRYRERKTTWNNGQQNNLVQVNEKGLIKQIKRMKKKAQKMVQLQSQRRKNQYYRKTFDVSMDRPEFDDQTYSKQKRFRRIR